jgi:hypothetical protein
MIINGKVVPTCGNFNGIKARGKMVFIGKLEKANCCSMFFDRLVSSLKERGAIIKVIDRTYTELDFRNRFSDHELLDLLDSSRGKT